MITSYTILMQILYSSAFPSNGLAVPTQRLDESTGQMMPAVTYLLNGHYYDLLLRDPNEAALAARLLCAAPNTPPERVRQWLDALAPTYEEGSFQGGLTVEVIKRPGWSLPASVRPGRGGRLVLVGPDIPAVTPVAATDIALRFEQRVIGQPCPRAFPLLGNRLTTCFSGAFIWSNDSRFPSGQPLPLHI